MKKSFLFLTVLFCLIFAFTFKNANAQGKVEKCATMEHLQKQKDDDPELDAKMKLHESQLQKWVEDNYGQMLITDITIPVVVHILYNNSDQNLSEARVFEQIEASNTDFAGLNPHSMWSFSSNLKAKTGIQLCLAKKTPDGKPTTGIEWRETSVAGFPANDAMKFYSTGGLDAWDPKMYLNIWVCNFSSSSLCGYAQFPTSGINATYGVVISYKYFGKTGAFHPYNQGGTTTHEIGHCLNLYHIWGDDNGSCRGSDYCADVPNQANNTYGSPEGVLTDACSKFSPGIMYMNFMDYSDDIVYANFTPNQTGRIQALFASPGGPLVPLMNSTACSVPSNCEIPTSLAAGSLSKSGAVLNWTAMYGAASYSIRYRKAGTSTWTSSTSETNSLSITGLTRNTSYEFQVQTVCSNGYYSDYSASCLFKTPSGGKGKGKEFIAGYDDQGISADFYSFPNPANGQATINYSITESALVSFTITNSMGIEMARIGNNEKQEPGEYSLNVDTGNLAPGAYYLTIRAGEITGTKSMLVVR